MVWNIYSKCLDKYQIEPIQASESGGNLKSLQCTNPV